MKLLNKRGSTLVFTIIIFAVLMIFAAFISSFMVTENKQAIYYQNKTEAYYIARSGAEVVEAAIRKQLLEYKDDLLTQEKIIDLYDSPGQDIDVIIDHINEPVFVLNEIINGRRVLTIKSTAEFQGITQTVKKGVNAEYSNVNDAGFSPSGKLFLYLGDEKPKEFRKSGGFRHIPPDYITEVLDEDKGLYKEHAFPVISYWDVPNAVVIDGKITDGNFNDINEIFVDGNLIMQGDIKFEGDTDIYIRGTLEIKNYTNIIGDKKNNGIDNKLNIYVYNENNESTAIKNDSYFGTNNNGHMGIKANIYCNSGEILLGMPQNSSIDGHIVFNGNEEIHIKTNSNGTERVITGSIYAPFGSVHLGIATYQLAASIAGQVIADSIGVYVNNPGKGDDFYKLSSEHRINNPIPISFEGIDTESIKYNSFFMN